MPQPQLASRLPERPGDASTRRPGGLHTLGPDGESPAAGPARVLLVENDPAMGFLLAQTLSAHYRVETVTENLAAWQLARRHPPDLVILGLYISGKDKLALTHTLRAGLEKTSLPIILLSASANRELLLGCLAAGASNFLLSPFSMAEFLACVRLELDLHAALPLSGR